MGYFLGKILCILKIHHWMTVRFKFGEWTECSRCGKKF